MIAGSLFAVLFCRLVFCWFFFNNEILLAKKKVLRVIVLFYLCFQVNRLNTEGFYGGVRLLMAICKVFYNYCKDNNIDLHGGNFTLSYDTNIPRQVILKTSGIRYCLLSN